MKLEYSTEIDRDIVANHPVHIVDDIDYLIFYPSQCKLAYSYHSVSEVVSHIVMFTLSTKANDPIDVCLQCKNNNKYITRTGREISHSATNNILHIVNKHKTHVLPTDNIATVEVEPIREYSY